MTTPALKLQTVFALDAQHRITSTREPGASRGPLFCLVRGVDTCAWAVRADVPKVAAEELEALAQLEPPSSNFEDAPIHAGDFLSVLAGRIAPACDVVAKRSRSDGPAFTFSKTLIHSPDVVVIEDETRLAHHFSGWVPGEIAAGRSPVVAVIDDGRPVSICFCARNSPAAAEAGVNTTEAWRGRGFAPRVVAAWALAIQASGRVPLYSTSWTNTASLAVARKLGLTMYASDWSLYD